MLYKSKYNCNQTTLTNGQRVVAKALNDCDYCAMHLASMTEMMVSSVHHKRASVKIHTAVTKYLLPSYLELEALAKKHILV